MGQAGEALERGAGKEGNRIESSGNRERKNVRWMERRKWREREDVSDKRK